MTTIRWPRCTAFIDIMGHEQGGRVFMLDDPLKFVLQLEACQRIQRAERFVEQKKARAIDQRAGDGNALGHAARELRGVGLCELRQADKARYARAPSPAFCARESGLRRRAAGDIGLDGEPG